jgi:POT family proton-dependent oligopeptide transporter
MIETSATAPQLPVSGDQQMPKGIWFIVSNEFAERFCFYGINSILAVYFTQFLHFTDGRATSWQSLFKSGAYFFPLLGAVVSDAFWGKFRTIMVFSSIYAAAVVGLALAGSHEIALAMSLFFIGLGTGGIKPCVATNLGDQFTSRNQHLIERAFSWFYLSINTGSLFSIYLCPVLLEDPAWGPRWAFGLPAVLMATATVVFVAGRRNYVAVPPAGKAWLEEIRSPRTVKLVFSLLLIYFFVAIFWMLWDQSNGGSWTLQAQSSLVDKQLLGPRDGALGSLTLGSWKVGELIVSAFTLRGAQVQVVNGLFIIILAPVFSYWVYPFVGRFTRVTPLRKIGAGLFFAAASFLMIAFVESRLMAGQPVSAWWQILAYVVLTCGEVLVSITALEFSYKQAPLTIKSFIMALFYLSISVGNLGIAAVNNFMTRPLAAEAVEVGPETWVRLPEAASLVVGQKLDIAGDTQVSWRSLTETGEATTGPLGGTFLVAEIDAAAPRVRLVDNLHRRAVVTSGAFDLAQGKVSTTWLVGPNYYLFFIGVMALAGLIFIFVALRYQEQTHVRTEEAAPAGA